MCAEVPKYFLFIKFSIKKVSTVQEKYEIQTR